MLSRNEWIIRWQSIQIPIFKHLIENNSFLKDYNIVCSDQYVSMEKRYGKIWINIEIEDAQSLEDIDCYVVTYNLHDSNWLPSKVEEEGESIPIKTVTCDTIDELKKLIESL